ncbi:hypothetical protein HDC93_006764 [Streptomyces sp. AK010]|nr:hypothetical protein [Streptomyces sp. AK010]
MVLLSHDEHFDNLDISGRALLAGIPLTLTTPDGSKRLGQKATGLADWESVELERPGGGTVTVTGVPAIHGPGPREEVESLSGQVVGFVLDGEGLPTVYVSGDNASLEVVGQIAERFAPVDTALLFRRRPALLDALRRRARRPGQRPGRRSGPNPRRPPRRPRPLRQLGPLH